jgi:hypothetical protein
MGLLTRTYQGEGHIYLVLYMPTYEGPVDTYRGLRKVLGSARRVIHAPLV